MISPAGPTRASRRASWRSISASSPRASGSSGSRPATTRASRIASAHSSRRIERVARRCRVALVEHEVQDAQHAVEPFGQELGRRHAIGDAGVADLALGPDEALGQRRLGDQERAGDLGRRQPAQRSQRERHPGVERERRVAAGEDQAQSVVRDVHRILCRIGVDGAQVGLELGLARQRLGLRDEALAPPQAIDRPVARGRRDPRPGIGRDAPLGPRLERADERILDGLLGEVEVAGDPDQGCDGPALLLAEQAVDDVVGGVRLGQAAHDRRGRQFPAVAEPAGSSPAIW